MLHLRNFGTLRRALSAAIGAPAAACSRCLHAPAASPLARAGFLRAAPAAQHTEGPIPKRTPQGDSGVERDALLALFHGASFSHSPHMALYDAVQRFVDIFNA